MTMEDRRPSEAHPSALEPVQATRARRRRVWLLVTGVVAAVGLVAAFGSFGLSRDPEHARSALLGKRAPDVAMATLDGSHTMRLSALRGQVVVVNFWASWCKPCQTEHPGFVAAWDRFRDRGVVFVGVLYQDSVSRGRAFQRKWGGDWPLVNDADGRIALAFGVFGVPETFFIGPDGRVALVQVGATKYEVLTEQVTRLLEERSE
jgi:cytochrome c biogenesis protein CcmG/thiol:disulfide interchange protein DsbE